jgi:hypothetical protein
VSERLFVIPSWLTPDNWRWPSVCEAEPLETERPGTERYMTHYQRLGVSPSAGQMAIHRAWRARVRLVHPDHATGAGDATRRTAASAELNVAYHTLSDPTRRAVYDLDLAQDQRSAPISEPTPSATRPGPTPQPAWSSYGATYARARPEFSRRVGAWLTARGLALAGQIRVLAPRGSAHFLGDAHGQWQLMAILAGLSLALGLLVGGLNGLSLFCALAMPLALIQVLVVRRWQGTPLGTVARLTWGLFRGVSPVR